MKKTQTLSTDENVDFLASFVRDLLEARIHPKSHGMTIQCLSQEVHLSTSSSPLFDNHSPVRVKV